MADEGRLYAGRDPLKRYGGEKIWEVNWSVAPPPSPLPPANTRPSGISAAVEWYTRTTAALARVLHVPDWGSYSSSGNTAAVSSLNPQLLVPPVASTVPSGSTVRLNWRRAKAMEPVAVQVGVPALRSITSADLWGTEPGHGSSGPPLPPPPAYSTLLSSMTAAP